MKEIKDMDLNELRRAQVQIENRIDELEPDDEDPKEVKGSGGSPAIEF
jgi:hypothetical protein